MRVIVQRVRRAQVTVLDHIVGRIEGGMLVLFGVGQGDEIQDAQYLAEKLIHLRIFNDDAGKMNRSLMDVKGQMLVVSQFTLYGDCRKGRRPSFSAASSPEIGKSLYEFFCEYVRQQGIYLQTGMFQSDMQVELVNDGPVTLMLDSSQR